MKQSTIILILRIVMPLVAVGCLVVFVPWGIVGVWIKPLPETVQTEVDNAINHGFDGIIVYIDQAGETDLYAAGWMNREKKIPANPQALFKIASISKLYIAASVAKLVSIDSLSLDDRLALLLPDLNGRIEYADEISLRLLVQHRSGIPNYSDHPDYPWANPYKKNRENLDLVLDQPADFAPNEKYTYSNTNYLLIGEILDSTLGYSHHQYIKEEILSPLGLKKTFSLLSEVDLDEVMSGYYMGYEPDIKGNDFISPGGSMVSTAEEVGIFLRALHDGSLFTEEEQDIYSSIYSYEHTGLLPGYQSIARYHKDLDAVVIQFINTSGGYSWEKSEIIYSRILRVLREKQ